MFSTAWQESCEMEEHLCEEERTLCNLWAWSGYITQAEQAEQAEEGGDENVNGG